MHTLSLPVLSLALATLIAGRPRDVTTKVLAGQAGWTSGDASQVSQARGASSAARAALRATPTSAQLDEGKSDAAVALNGWYWGR